MTPPKREEEDALDKERTNGRMGGSEREKKGGRRNKRYKKEYDMLKRLVRENPVSTEAPLIGGYSTT